MHSFTLLACHTVSSWAYHKAMFVSEGCLADEQIAGRRGVVWGKEGGRHEVKRHPLKETARMVVAGEEEEHYEATSTREDNQPGGGKGMERAEHHMIK